MPNLVLNYSCVRSCPYCFAPPPSDAACELMSWDDLVYAVDFLTHSGVDSVAILGGEPSLHPHFLDFVEYALRRMHHISVFTSGIMPASVVTGLKDLCQPRETRRLSVVCNVNSPDITPPGEAKSVAHFLGTLGDLVSQGFNIYRTDFDLSFLLDNVRRFSLRPVLRMSLAHPLLGEPNEHLSSDDFDAVAARLCSFIPQLQAANVTLSLDCGFTLCSFSDVMLGQLARIGTSFSWRCAPIVDIGPDLRVWSCFPLKKMGSHSLLDFDSMDAARKEFIRIATEHRGDAAGAYAKCASCLDLGTRCGGGCLAHFLTVPAAVGQGV